MLKYRIRKGQTKSKVKLVLRETIKIQNNNIKKFNTNQSLSDRLFKLAEKILLILPNRFIYWMFMKLNYKKFKSKNFKLTDGGGMYLLVTKTGKYWRYDYRYMKKRKTLAAG